MPYVTRYNEFTNSDERVWIPETTSSSFSSMPEFLPGGGRMPSAAGPFPGGVTTGGGNQDGRRVLRGDKGYDDFYGMYEDFGMPGAMPQFTQRTDSSPGFTSEEDTFGYSLNAKPRRFKNKTGEEVYRDVQEMGIHKRKQHPTWSNERWSDYKKSFINRWLELKGYSPEEIASYQSYSMNPEGTRNKPFYETQEEEIEREEREKFGLKPDIRVKTFDWDSIPGSTIMDEYDEFQNIYKGVFDDDSLYRGQWKSFEDVLREKIGEEIPKSGVPGFNQKRNSLLKLRDWYNDERSINQRSRTEEEWKKAGLPVGDFGFNGRYEITQEDWEKSDIGKKYLKDNPPAIPSKGYSRTERENLKDAFSNFNSQWSQNFSKGNPISNLDFFVSGEDTEVVEDDRAGIDDAFGDAFDVDGDDGEVIIPEPEGIREGDARQNYISDFLAGQIPGYEWIATVGPDEMSDEAKREMAGGLWENEETKSKYGVVGPSPEPVVTTEGTDGTKILTNSVAEINAFKTLADYSGQSLPSIIKMSVDGTLPSIPPALLEELKRPLIRIQQPTGELDLDGNPITIGVDIPNPNIEPLFNIYRTQLDTQVEAFRLAQQKDISAADRDSRFNQALVSATGGLAGTGTEKDFGPTALAEQERRMARIAATGGLESLNPQQLQDFQQQQALIGATGGLSGIEGGLTPEALAQQELQRQQISATGGLSGLTPFSGAPTASEAARIQQQLFGADPARAISSARSLTPFEMAQLQLQPLRMQQAQEQARREEEQRQFNEQLAINQRAQQLAELESQRRLGLQSGQLQQQRQLELARLFSDPTAVGSLSAIYGPQFFEQEQVFGSPFGGQPPLPDTSFNQLQNPQQPSFTPATNVSTPFGSSLTTGQFQEMSPYGQGQYLTTQARQKGKSRQELEREMEAVTPFGTPTGRGGLDKYFSGTGEL